MVYNGTSHENGCFGGIPSLGNPHMKGGDMGHLEENIFLESCVIFRGHVYVKGKIGIP